MTAFRRGLGAVVLLAASSLWIPAAHATPFWAPASVATIYPGVQTITNGMQCTANFVFYDENYAIYIGQAAHCASTSGSNVTNGCVAGSLPLGTPVMIDGARVPGTLVYSSWLSMQWVPEPVASLECRYNDFALVRLEPVDYFSVNPSVPYWGGPVALSTNGAPTDSKVYTYGDSPLRLGLPPLSPKAGVCMNGDTGQAWNHRVYTVTPGSHGDTGSAFLDVDGEALGDFATFGADGSNNVTDLNHALAYLDAHAPIPSLTLATGTEPFRGL